MTGSSNQNIHQLSTGRSWRSWWSRLISSSQIRDLRAQAAAIDRSQAVVQFSVDGKILSCNQNFLDTMGYTRAEVIGQHHSMFVEPAYRASDAYRLFWEKLARGEYDAASYKRLAKGGREIWLQASYNPVFDGGHRPTKVIKYATEITEQTLRNADFEGQLDAIGKSQAVIEFSLDGRIQKANGLFLDVMGYTADEIIGRHHSMFVDRDERQSPGYRAFWDKLARGEHDTGRYQRFGKNGRSVWIQASYNPIFDRSGRPFKVVKYATDVTEQVMQARLLSEAVEQTQTVVDSACSGDLTVQIPMEGKTGAVAELCAGVNQLIDNMASVVGQIKQSTQAISLAATEIAAGNLDLSTRTEQTAASLEETASSMEELTSTVKQNADNAKQANQLVLGTVDVARRGGTVVGDVVKTMAEINESSRKIVDIITVIDSIAFQTNILALNAAVEAARAGEQGRGFAVVASEVRSLAQRSAGAAREIKTLIGDSVEKVGAGSRLVEQAGTTMDEIVISVKRVTDIMAEIAAASQEQSQGIEQVNRAVTQLDEVTQQNAALVEEASSAARSLEEQTVGLNGSVSHFVVSAAGPAASTAAPVAVVAARPVTGARSPSSPRAAVTKLVTRTARGAGSASTSNGGSVANRPARRSAGGGSSAAASAGGASGSEDQWTEF
ncbi:methyl-accepting chemotaxis sensory transducer with Pas/Pac sensor [Hydrocarboniphaga daqingensis]|uniref:Methyl-accepting chemotaxis sensory transducer with Pas/Pac sensor n=1 Tax=Hydrocarboniphaga daqingensis TaxID=490188 RepID=A0A1M5K714_9GAMM|nr:methyl-accepting chemotaxis protein [Hydrocarboniphaga daqingensis]SHG48289.1 methyl-accepting chemotaxis sensory transducer with Pas/Pac sensor [Hydrocarboniphaga daqingensis]